MLTCLRHVGAVPCLGTDAQPPLRRSSNSFRPLHLRAYRARRIRSYRHHGGWHPLPSNSVNPSGSVSLCLGGKSSPSSLSKLNFGLSTVANRLVFLAFGPFSISFRINTCISVASKQLYPPLESTLAKKQGEGGGGVSGKAESSLFPNKFSSPKKNTAEPLSAWG